MLEHINGETDINPFSRDAYTFMEIIVEVFPEWGYPWQRSENSWRDK